MAMDRAVTVAQFVHCTAPQAPSGARLATGLMGGRGNAEAEIQAVWNGLLTESPLAGADVPRGESCVRAKAGLFREIQCHQTPTGLICRGNLLQGFNT